MTTPATNFKHRIPHAEAKDNEINISELTLKVYDAYLVPKTQAVYISTGLFGPKAHANKVDGIAINDKYYSTHLTPAKLNRIKQIKEYEGCKQITLSTNLFDTSNGEIYIPKEQSGTAAAVNIRIPAGALTVKTRVVGTKPLTYEIILPPELEERVLALANIPQWKYTTIQLSGDKRRITILDEVKGTREYHKVMEEIDRALLNALEQTYHIRIHPDGTYLIDAKSTDPWNFITHLGQLIITLKKYNDYVDKVK